MPTTSAVQTGFARVNGLQIYYELRGEPRADRLPVVLLHGGGDTIETSFGRVIEPLAAERQVIAFEQQGYGRTADVPDRPFSFTQSADDAAALLQFLHVPQADVFGFSNGGTIALQLAIRHPKLVRKLVVASGFFNRSGGYPWFWDMMKNATFEGMPQELKDAYITVAPRPENLIQMYEKSVERMRSFTDIPEEAIRGIGSPALVIVGDADVVRPEHAVETYRLIQNSQLAVLPGTDHMRLMKRAEWVAPMVNAFLDAPLPVAESAK